MSLNVSMKAVPDDVCNNWLSRSSLSCWTSFAISLPYVAVAIRQPPPSSFICTSIDFSSVGSGEYSISGSSSTIGFSFSTRTGSSTEGSDRIVVCCDVTVGKDLPCCSEVYPVSPMYFLIIDL